MFREMKAGRSGRLLALIVPLAIALVLPGSVGAAGDAGEMSDELRAKLLAPVQEWAKELTKEKNADDKPFRKCSYSRNPRKIDDATYEVTAHVNTAVDDQQRTERYRLTLKSNSGGKSWELAEKEVVDTLVGLYRPTGIACFPFDKFSFDQEGMTLSASNGSVCETFQGDRVTAFGVHSNDLTHRYEPPAHAQLCSTGHDFYDVHQLMAKDHSDQLDFKAFAFFFQCDDDSCDEILETSFTGLADPSREERKNYKYDLTHVDDWGRKIVEEFIEKRTKDPFEGLTTLGRPGHSWYSAFVSRTSDYEDGGVWLTNDNWAGWEVTFGVAPKRWDMPDQLRGDVYGYFSEKTLESTTPYELEQRETNQTRWFEVYSVKGQVDLAVEDAETVHGDVEFGLNLKQDVEDLPFFIISFSDRGYRDDPKPIVVNSVTVNGEDVTWVQTGPISGRVILPEKMAAGTRVQVGMDWKSEALIKFTHSYSYMPRQGWMPFVRFGDMIDEFDLIVRAPSKYDILGVGHDAEERVEGGLRIQHRVASSPVNFPTVILGKYESATPKFDAKKLDGTVIPVAVHVDEASFGSWDIRSNALRPIAEQAANSINLYAKLSGLDYPFGELNLVNDPQGFLYGQAPSTIIYLGSGVFRGEGALAPYMRDSAGIAKFLRSVVAHEVGHQWWGNRIANANMRNYWFVESLAEYFSAIYLEMAFGWKEYEDQVDEWRANILSSHLKGSVQNASTLFSGEWGGGLAGETDTYTASVYNKGPYAFHMLRETFKGPGPRGPDGADQRFYAFLSQFSQELAEKREIVTLDIQEAAEKALGGVDEQGNPYRVDLSWFFDQWIRGTGVPQYALDYDVRQAEDGAWVIEGVIRQRVLIGTSDGVLAGTVYRGVVDVTVEAKGGPFVKRFVINAGETPIKLRVPSKPQEVALNKSGEMLARDTLYNNSW